MKPHHHLGYLGAGQRRLARLAIGIVCMASVVGPAAVSATSTAASDQADALTPQFLTPMARSASVTGHYPTLSTAPDPRLRNIHAPDNVCHPGHGAEPLQHGLRSLPRNGCAALAESRQSLADRSYEHARPDLADMDAGDAVVSATLASNPPPTYASPDWVQQAPATSPAGRYGEAMAYDEAHHQVVLFGGSTGSAYFNDTWLWNGMTWTQAAPSASPTPRSFAQMAYDEATGTVVLFGGEDPSTPALSDTWTWNGTTWTELSPATSPPGRSDAALAYDAQASKLVLFGGSGYSGASGTADLGDTWTWDGVQWRVVTTTPMPSARTGARAAYDAVHSTVVLFGGVQSATATYLADTWTFNGTSWSHALPTAAPSGRSDFFFGYDGGLPGAVLFGGYAGNSGDVNDTWRWDGTGWALASGIASPSGRDSGAMAFDMASGQLLQLGGSNGFTNFAETWTYNTGVPTLTDSVSPASASRGSYATYTLVIGDSSPTFGISGASVVDTLPNDVLLVPTPAISVLDVGTRAACTTCRTSVSGRTVSVSGMNIAPQDSYQVTFSGFALGSDRGCEQVSDQATPTGPSGTGAPVSAPLTICDSGLGVQPWWHDVSWTTGPQGGLAVNPANGDAVVTQEDATFIPDHGVLGFGVTRVYNTEDTQAQTLPLAIGAGWVTTIGQQQLAAGGVTADGLIVPSQNTAGVNTPVTLVDGTGTRLVFLPRVLAQPVDITAIAAASAPTSPLGALKPLVLQLDTAHYDHLCVDSAYDAPAGVHLGLWRYVELQAASSSAPCTPAAGTTPAVVGFAGERTDRVRFEFAWDGHLLGIVDGSGNQLQYLYAQSPTAGVALGDLQRVRSPLSGRHLTLSYPSATEVDVVDPANRRTVYQLDTSAPPRLTSVVNPDGAASTITYSYAACTGASPNQLCSVSDLRSAHTTLTYGNLGLAPGSPSGVVSVTDRAGTLSSIAYSASPDTTTVTTGAESTTYSIAGDAVGRVADIVVNGASGAQLVNTAYAWDTASSSCRQPDHIVDNDLCSMTEYGGGNAQAAPTETTRYAYNPEGRVLIENRSSGRVRTAGYHAQYLETSGVLTTYDDAVQGAGQVTSDTGPGASGQRADAGTLLVLSDATQSLSDRGNAPAIPNWSTYLTTLHVDDNAQVNPNAVNSSGTCANPSSASANSGNLCEVDAPSFNGTAPTVIRYAYGADGQRTSMTSPKAIAETPSGQAIPASSLTYYGNADLDLSGTVTTSGWLKGVTDPQGHFVAIAYDAAGNPTRVWDRNATQGLTLAQFPGATSAPPSSAYTEDLHSPTSNSYGAPWRYVTSRRDQLGNVTALSNDPNGNVDAISPPRATAGSGGGTTIQTYDARDLLTSKATGVDRTLGVEWHYSYDAFGNLTSTIDPVNNSTVTRYDLANRPVETDFSRGPWPSDLSTVPSSCRESTNTDAPIPAGRILCDMTRAYDMRSNVISSNDADGQRTDDYFDADNELLRHQAYRTVSTGTLTLATTYTYDVDGNTLSVCSANGNAAVAAGTYLCGNPGYTTSKTYDLADRLQTVTTYDSTTGAPIQTAYGYDADGNLISTRDANGHITTSQFDFLDRVLATTTPRDASTSNTTYYLFDPSGSKVAEAQPYSTGTNCVITASSATPAGCLVTAFSYDADHRLVDTVKGADNTSATLAGLVDSNGGSNVRTRVMYDQDGNPVATFEPRAFVPYAGVADPRSAPNPAFMARTDYDADDRAVASYVPRYDNGSYSDESTQLGIGSSSTQAAQCSTGAVPQSIPNVPTYAATVGVCVTRVSYDAVNDRIELTLPTSNGSDNRFYTYTYTDDRLLASATAPSPSTAGQRVTAESYLYDGNGREVVRSDALGHGMSTAYTSDGLVAQETGTPNAAITHQTSYTYDDDGNKISETDPAQNTTTWTYYTDDRLSSTADPMGDTTSYTYDGVGNTLQVYSPSANARDAANTAGVPTTMTYTWDNLPSTERVPVAPDGSSARETDYTYGGAGQKLDEHVFILNGTGGIEGGNEGSSYYSDLRLHVLTGTDGATITTAYDAAGDRTSVVDSTGASSLTGTYYLDGRPRTVDDGTYTTRYAYDGSGSEVADVGTPDAGGAGTGTLTTYTDAELPSSLQSNVTAPTGQTLGTTTYTYDAAGRSATEHDPDGNTSAFSYSADDTLNSLTVTGSGGNVPGVWSYTYDNDYRQLQQGFSGVGAAPTGIVNGTFSYAYDSAGRVHLFTEATATGTTTEQATWDHNGDRLQVGNSHWTYNADGSIATSQSGALPVLTYQYAPFGGISSDVCTSYTYDGFYRLMQESQQTNAQCPPPSMTATTFTYDGLDRQRTRKDGTGTTTIHSDGWDQRPLEEHQVTSNATTDNLYELDPTGTTKAVRQSGTTTEQFLADDGFGNVGMVFSQSGAVACTARFDAFGRPQGALAVNNDCNTGSTIDQYFYRDGRVDGTTGDTYFGFRSYDPSKATFIVPDSYRDGAPSQDVGLATDPLTANGFAYENGDPVNFWDPSGHGLYCTLGPDCQELQATPSDDGNGGSVAAQISAAHAPGYTPGTSSEKGYGSAHTKPRGRTSVARLRAGIRMDEARLAKLAYLNADTGSGYVPAAQDCALVTPRDYGTMPTVNDGCDRNPGGVCHNPGGYQQIACTYSDAIAGPAAPQGVTYTNELVVHSHCHNCVLHTLQVFGMIIGGPEEDVADLGVTALTARAATDSEIVASAADSSLAARSGAGNGVMEVSGDAGDAQSYYDEVSQYGTDVTPQNYPGQMTELPGGGRIGFRPASKSGPPTLDFNVPDIPWRKIKFLGEDYY